nr:MAG TPA: replisome organizer [Bacteriophage sp.]
MATTDKETRKIIAVLMVAYPNYKPINIDFTVSVWTDILSDYSYSEVDMAIKAYISTDTSGFAPAIGQVIDKIKSITTPRQMTDAEAWSLVRKAISDSGYNAMERFAELPIVCQRAVGSPAQLRMWALDTAYNENVVSSNFMRSYRTEVARQNELDRMPKEIRQIIQKINNNNSKLLSEYEANQPKRITKR